MQYAMQTVEQKSVSRLKNSRQHYSLEGCLVFFLQKDSMQRGEDIYIYTDTCWST